MSAALRAGLVALLAAGMAGCYEDEGATAWSVDGTFTLEATEAQMDELGSKASELGGRMVLLESHPEQFVASGFSSHACETFQSYADLRPYVDTVSACKSTTLYEG